MYPAISSLSHPPPTPSIPEDQWHFSPILLHPTYCISHYQLVTRVPEVPVLLDGSLS